MTKHTDTSRSGDLVARLRGDWPEILVEKHWMIDSDAIDKQREEAADRIEALEAEIARKDALIEKAVQAALDAAADYCHSEAEQWKAKFADLNPIPDQVICEVLVMIKLEKAIRSWSASEIEAGEHLK